LLLHETAKEGHPATVQRLLDQKADLQEKDSDEYTPLH
jgi:hypothetical protein